MATHSRSRVRDAPVAEERRPILNDDEPNYDSIHDSRNGILPADKNKLSKGDLVWVMTGLFATGEHITHSTFWFFVFVLG
jgi:hypothetical protein